MTDTPSHTSITKPSRVLRFVIAIALLPVLALIWLASSQTGLQWAFQLAQSHVPGELKLASLEGSLIGPITLKGIAYSQNGTQFRLDQLTLDWSPVTLFSARITVNRVRARTLHISLPTTAGEKPANLPDIQFPWRLALADVVIDDITLQQDTEMYALQQIRLDAATRFDTLHLKHLAVRAAQFGFSINGSIKLTHGYPHELDSQWWFRLPSSALIRGHGQLQGNLEHTRLNQTLRGPLQLTLDARFSELLSQPRWQAKVEARTADASTLSTALPAISGSLQLHGSGDLYTARMDGETQGQFPELGPFSGNFELYRMTDKRILIEQLRLNAPATDSRLVARGEWLPGDKGGSVDLALQWQNLYWPPRQHTWFDSAIGSAWITGNLQHYRFGLATSRPWLQAPTSFWYASAEGAPAGLDFSSLRVHTPQGEAQATGTLAWSPKLAWQANVIATDIDPAGLFPQIPQLAQWPGRLQATLQSSGSMTQGRLTVTADIGKLTGTLRGYPVSLRSRASWSDEGIDIGLLDLHSGSTQIKARGRIGNNLQLDWFIDANDIAELYPQGKGQLYAKGRLEGTRTSPQITATLSGRALQLPGYAIGSVEATLAADMFRWQQLDFKLSASSVTIQDYAIHRLEIGADKHGLQATAVAKKETLQLELRGILDATGWQGHIQRADVQSGQFGDWQLTKPSPLAITKTTLAADDLCWHDTHHAQVCASLRGEKQQAAAWQGELDIKHLPLALFKTWFVPGMQINGKANATAEWQLIATDQLQGHAAVSLQPGTISYPLAEGETEEWDYRSGELLIDIDEKGLNASADVALADGDRLDGQLSLPGAKVLAIDTAQQTLRASVHLQLRRIAFIETVVNDVQGMRGELAVNLFASGTLAHPIISGQTRLRNGSMRIPRLGLKIRQLTMDGQSDEQNRLHFQLAAHSGEGNIAIDGFTTLDPLAGWPTELSIKGKAFEVSRIPEARVVVSPDLRITLQQQRINIQGDINIPYAKLQPKDLTTATRASSDVVIIGEQKPAEAPWAVHARIRVVLGEQVTFYGFGFEGRFGGNLLISDDPGQVTTASGELAIIEGHYRAYGQRLDVEHGRLLYTGGPVSNPGLDLTAVRHINEVTAGLRVRGSLNRPQVELFSLPAMGMTDTFSYLLLGRPIESASGDEGAMMAKAALALGLSGGNHLARSLSDRFGLDEMRVESSAQGEQASLVIGRYLSAKLYVSYGVGLIKAFNTFTVQYRISSNWLLKAESGEYQGADILYTIER